MFNQFASSGHRSAASNPPTIAVSRYNPSGDSDRLGEEAAEDDQEGEADALGVGRFRERHAGHEHGEGETPSGVHGHDLALGSDELKQRIAPPVLAGEKIIALGITEAGGGSDVANLKTTAVRDGDSYIVNGGKMFITSGMRADWLTCAVRTGGPGAAGISLLLIDMNSPGVERTRLDKMGWRCSDTAAIHFGDVRVPAENLIGQAHLCASTLIRRNSRRGERLPVPARAP